METQSVKQNKITFLKAERKIIMKRFFASMLAAAVLITAAGCSGNSTPAELSDSFIERDVQDYIVEMLDENSKITDFEKVSSDINGKEMIVICNAAFTVDGEQQQGEFTLTYEVEKNAWVLLKCRVELPEKQEESDGNDDEANAKKDRDTTEKPDEPEAQLPAQTEVVELSDNLFDYTFELDGVVYQLPCEYSLFKDNGWVISTRGFTENTEISAYSYEYLDMIKDGNEIQLYPINLSGNVKKLKDCKIGGIDVSRYDLADVNIFTIAKNLNLNSSVGDFTAAHGAANSTSTYDDWVSLEYFQDYNREVSCNIHTDGTTRNSITIKNFVKDESDITETSTKVPEYLASYTAPTELGTDPFSGNIEIDGELYRLPCPVSAFTDNGWSITSLYNYWNITGQSPDDGVGGGDTAAIKIERNGKDEYVLSIANFASYQTIPENCAVYAVDADDSDKIPVKLPGNISFDSTKADVENYVSDKFSYYNRTAYNGTTYHEYSYDEYDDNYNTNFSIDIYIDAETEKVYKISLGHMKWDY